MPHISIYACDLKRNIERIHIHAEVHFSKEYFVTPKAREKLKQLQQEIEDIIEIYFDDYESDIYQNHEWNVNVK